MKLFLPRHIRLETLQFINIRHVYKSIESVYHIPIRYFTEKQQKQLLKDNLDDISFVHHRIKLFDDVWNKQQEEVKKLQGSIKITLPNNTVKEVKKGTSPYDIAKEISLSLAKKAILAKVNDEVYDLTRPLLEDCNLQILTFDDKEGKHTFWHSSAHVLGESLERLYKGKLTVGPALPEEQMLHNGGFYYDVDTKDLGDDVHVTEDHYKEIENLINKLTKEKQEFKRVVLKKEEALEMFKFNKYKQELISSKIEDGSTCTAYRCGPLIDLCRGPHIPNTGLIKALKVVKHGASYWKGDNKLDNLQRIYGISFPDKKLMKEYSNLRKRAQESDHRKIGNEQKLFFFNELSPGSCFWLPHGSRIYNTLKKFVQSCYRERGYTEVITPNMYSLKLWEISGHAAKYKEDMFLLDVENQQFGLKPMNCPGHCLMYAHEIRSYRDLPIRFADFGALHRNEKSGSLTGLTRVRRFQQDDAHIFCRFDQIKQEVKGCLDFIKFIYDKFGFKFSLELSTRPEQYLGEIETWDEAEKQLQECLDEFVDEHKEMPKPGKDEGGGAFYGPKIDIKVYDSLQREHQCATVQLDFQLPSRFGLEYMSEQKEKAKPIIVHRAIYGSFERFIGILCEHLSGKWPFWLSPRQCIVIPVTQHYNEYAQQVKDKIFKAGYWCDVDLSRNRMPKKIRSAQVIGYNYILVVGEKEQNNASVNIRTRDDKDNQIEKKLDETLVMFGDLIKNFQ